MRPVALFKSLSRRRFGAPPVELPPLPAGPPPPQAATLRPFADACYAIIAAVALPFYALRLVRKPIERSALRERFGLSPRRAGERPCVWVHAVSVGEVQVARPLVDRLARRHPGWDVVVSTTTTTGQEVARKAWPGRTVFFMPIDLSGCVRSAYRRVRPDVVVLVELEVWPNHVLEAAARGVPTVIVNGRVTEEALHRYQWVIHPWRRVMAAVGEVGAQNRTFADRLVDLGVPRERVTVSGNMKYDAVDMGLDETAGPAVRAELGIAADAPVLLGGSTHEPEEEALLRAWEMLAVDHPRLRLILVPRHPERFERVADLAAARGFRCLRRSRRETFSGHEREVFLLDTMGELRRTYAAADVVFVGGSLIPHGGQNLLEPAALAKPVVHGPHMANFADGARLLAEHGGAFEVAHGTDLAQVVDRLLRDPVLRAATGRAARSALAAERGAADRNADLVERAMQRRLAAGRVR